MSGDTDTERLAAALSDVGLVGPIDIGGQGDMFAAAFGGRGTEAATCKTCGAMVLLNSPLYESDDPGYGGRLLPRGPCDSPSSPVSIAAARVALVHIWGDMDA